ncbi:hypothetical protein CN681_30910 [Bacillus toyonensis]|nr:hypothetical protein CN681_30910 [Bacillus toyonensis]PGA53472.1 hypothetical protein COL86_20045 [Bacillus toyonensis]PGB89510.1 hypothetical protein COM19_31550 [Bacillus toyonensis]
MGISISFAHKAPTVLLQRFLNEIKMEEKRKDPVVFEIKKDGDEYKTQAIKKKYEGLALSSSKE